VASDLKNPALGKKPGLKDGKGLVGEKKGGGDACDLGIAEQRCLLLTDWGGIP